MIQFISIPNPDEIKSLNINVDSYLYESIMSIIISNTPNMYKPVLIHTPAGSINIDDYICPSVVAIKCMNLFVWME